MNKKLKNIILDNKKILQKIDFSTIISTFFFIGLIPIAPGTFGSLAAYPIYYFLFISSLSHTEAQFSFFIISLILTFIGIKAINRFQKNTGLQDHKSIVIDEVIGQLAIFAIANQMLYEIVSSIKYKISIDSISALNLNFIAGFIIFRYFDIKKPLFIKYYDRKYKSGFGVILDDILAAGLGAFSIWIVYLIYSLF